MKIFLIFLFTSLVFAQTENPDSVKHEFVLDSVVIHASRYRQSSEISSLSFERITGDQVQNITQGISLNESLWNVPGVKINTRNNPALGDKIMIRGIGSRSSFGVRGIKILVDNIPMTLPDGQSQINNIDPGSAGVIEIIKGPGSALYGNSAGGIINIQTQKPSGSEFEFEPFLIAGNYGFRKIQTKLSGSRKDFSYMVNASNTKTNGYRDFSSYQYYQVNALTKYNLSEQSSIKTIINYFNSPYMLNPGSLTKIDAAANPTSARFFNRQQGTSEKTNQLQTGINFSFEDKNKFIFDAGIYFISRSVINPIPGRIINLKRNAGGLRTTVSKDISLTNLNFKLYAGIDAETQIDKRREFENHGLPENIVDNINAKDIANFLEYGVLLINQNEQVFGTGQFAGFELKTHYNIILNGSLRYDSYFFKAEDKLLADNSDDSGSRWMHNLSPMFGITYLYRNYKFFGNFSTGFQTPTTSELSNRPDGKGGFNPSLNPEKIYSYELGVNSIFPEIFMTLKSSFFFFNINEMIFPYQLPDEETVFQNTGGAQNTGMELKVEFIPSSVFNLDFSFSHMNFIFKEELFNGKKVPGVPPNHFAAGINFKFLSQFSSKIEVECVDKFYTNDINGPEQNSNLSNDDFINDEYLTVNAGLMYNVEFSNQLLEIFFGVNNLFNEKYSASIITNAFGNRYFEPSPERNWLMGLKFRFNLLH